MAPSLATSALLALSLVSRALAFDDISIPTTVKAGEDVHVTLENDLYLGSDSTDAKYSNFRVFLGSATDGYSYPIALCWLVDNSAIDVTDLTVQIPASVGSSSSYYSLIVTSTNRSEDPDVGYTSFEQDSNAFTLSGGSGISIEQYLDKYSEWPIAFYDAVPCSAYDCARSCNDEHRPDEILEVADYEATYRCVAACPGVDYPSWESYAASLEDYYTDYDNYYDSASASTDAPATTKTYSTTLTFSTSSTPTQTTPSSAAAATASTTPTQVSAASTPSATVASQTTSGAITRAVIPGYALLAAFLASVMAVATL
ncbi:hypothetical protein PVAG01_05628 [Phlyctema vagabunda]|uniref:Uncharacterized protein n=1 Tax=Phlyctema vagabunda TaxID=108571 RepID=A0ABR4PKN3_9HELO